jgi:toxin HigB-1
MIKGYRHADPKRFFETGSKAGIQRQHAKRLRLQLGQLDAAIGPDDMDRLGLRSTR